MQTVSKQILDLLVELLSSVLVTLLCIGARHAISWLKAKANSTKINAALDELERAVIDGIYFAEQTLVREYKEHDGWTPEAQAEAKQACVDFVENLLTPAASSVIAQTEDELRRIIDEKIESKLGQIHAYQ